MDRKSRSYARVGRAALALVTIVLLLMPLAPSLQAQETGERSIQSPSHPRVEVEPELLAQVDADETTGYMIYFHERADLSPAFEMDWRERGWFVMNALQETAGRTQARVRAYLDTRGSKYQPYWIDNVIWVEHSDRATFDGLVDYTEIAALRAQRMMQVIEPVQKEPAGPPGILLMEPNLTHINVDQVWGLGYHGEGMVVANIDTGVRYTHNALEWHYRGCSDPPTCSSFDHDYNWLDPLAGDGTHTEPYDDHGHGSHTMGTMVGDDDGTNQIGMAPAARWIACDGCSTSEGCPGSALLTCAQWIAAPYPIGDPGSPDPNMRPHVVNNSWGDCGTSYDNWYQGSVNSWHAAGIYPVFSNGNASNCSYPEPPGCNTVGNPGRYGNVTGVGSTGQQNGQYATHSNWGPTDNADTVNPRGYPSLKPQVVAPGVSIRSSLNGSDSQYASWGGTSMSAPHVSGLIALVWQACPDLIGDYATTETLLETTATPIPYASGCGGEGPGNVPNHATGWGEIDAIAAVNEALNQCTPDFTLDVTPDSLGVCLSDDAVYDVTVGQINGFSDAVTLSTSGRPAGTTESFSVNPVTPPGASVLTIGNTGAATPGAYNIDVIGTAPGPVVHQDTVTLNLYDVAPGTPTLTSPPDASTGQSTTPNFDWSDVTGAATYAIQIATDPDFATIVDSATGLTDSNYTPGTALSPDTVYYWRVWADNACGPSGYSTVFAFRTAALPACSDVLLDGGFENGPPPASDWSESSARGWPVITSDYPRTGTYSTWMGGGSNENAQVWQTVAIDPSATSVTLNYWYWINSTDVCGYDYGYVRVNGSPVTTYDLCTSTDTGGYVEATEDLTGYTGSTELRFQATTDSLYNSSFLVDDVSVEVCTPTTPVTADYSDLDSGYGIAWHTGDGSLRLGATWDADTTFADGDDDASDDGVTFIGDLEPGQQVTVRVNVQGTPASGRWLRLWFDWDGDGVFDELADGELVYDDAVSDGDNDIVVDVPGSLAAAAYCRARLYDSAAAPAGILAQDPNSYGGTTGGEVEDGLSPDPVAVELARFEAWPDGPAIHVEWETTTEFDNLGFNLYRSDAAAGAYVQLNDDLIPSQVPGLPVGAVYAWRDEGVAPGATYYYRLEDVDVYGVTTLHGPLPATAGAPKYTIYLPLVSRHTVH